MPTMQDVRAKFPQYNDMTDQQLADALHRKFYADMPYDQFAAKIGLATPQAVADGKTDKPVSWTDTAIDAAKSLGTGVEQGVIGLAGMPADLGRYLGNAAGNAVDWAMGVPADQRAANAEKATALVNANPLAAPTTEGITKKVESVQGPMYKPQTVTGQYANTIGQFIPGAVAGPGSIARKAALAVVPAVASEGAGQLTEGTALEPYARFVGALVGGLAAAERGNVGTKAMLKDAPTYAEVEAAANVAYQKLRNAGVKYDANAVDQAINDVSKLRINPQLSPDASGLRDTFAQHLGKGMDFQDLDEMEQLATGILRDHNAKPADKFFTAAILKKIKDIRQSGAIATNGTVPANEVNALIAEAKDLGRRRIIGRDINKMKDKAEWYLSGPESGLRNQFKNYGSKNYQNLTPSEEAAFKAVVNREGAMNVAHQVGSRFVQPFAAAAGFGVGGPWGAVASVLGTQAARKFMEVYTKSGVETAIKTVLAGKNAQQRAAVLDALGRGQKRAQVLLTAETARQNNQIPFLTDANGQQYPYPAKTVPGQ